MSMAPLTSAAAHPTLAATLWPSQGIGRFWRAAILAVAGSLLLTLSAKIMVPFWPVEMTMQTFVVLSLGATLGWRLGSATVLLYLAQGAAGLPVFVGTPAKGIGLAYMAGPTGGYLLGFVLAAAVVGWLAQRGWDRNPGTTALAMLAGLVVLYVPGLLWLGTLMGWDKPILAWGLTPFLLGEALKLTLAAGLLPLIWKLAGRR